MGITTEINRIKTRVPETRFIAVPVTEAVASKDFYEGQLELTLWMSNRHWPLAIINDDQIAGSTFYGKSRTLTTG